MAIVLVASSARGLVLKYLARLDGTILRSDACSVAVNSYTPDKFRKGVKPGTSRAYTLVQLVSVGIAGLDESRTSPPSQCDVTEGLVRKQPQQDVSSTALRCLPSLHLLADG